ncbi:hypothetical protein D9V37_15955 [Nocardioides mangrovicus]|uniref:Serine kinase n=1 Tax=Nocardioides mangrovicus TaxID=2478913 RepID=A0A3L8NXJ3_9ACTN|nr:hypothetical protein [Nocardioides mangrovicus]RLV47654.1 hypothetical protein D9V37_15955 [Nocardioides mangrovicus]
MDARLELSALGAPLDLVVGGSRAQELHAALAERWELCLRGTGESDARTIEVSLGDEHADAVVEEVAVPRAAGADLDRLLVDVTHRVTHQAIAAGVGRLLMFHAAGVCDPHSGDTVVCVAPGGTGKTTLCRTLGRGRGYLSDETVGVADDGTVRPYPKPLSVRRDGSAVKDEVAPDRFGLRAAAVKPTVRAVLLLSREAAGARQPVVEKLDLFEAIVALAPETSSLARLSQPLHRLAALLEQTRLLARVRYDEAATLAPLVEDLIGPPRAEAS